MFSRTAERVLNSAAREAHLVLWPGVNPQQVEGLVNDLQNAGSAGGRDL